MKVQSHFNLQDRHTLAAPAVAEYFCACSSRKELCESLEWARQKQLPWRILAGGSNVVLDEFLPGLTMAPMLLGVEVLEESKSHVLLRVGAGESWHQLVEDCVKRGWYGLENLALIPGSAGAAPIQNIGAYGVELKNVLVSLTALDSQNLNEVEFLADECQFAYRDSLFKSGQPGRYIVTGIHLKLAKSANAVVSYPALQEYLTNAKQESTPENIFAAVVAIRQSKLPDPQNIPNAGSFFKNPLVSQTRYQHLKAQYPALVGFVQEDQSVKLAAAWLIDQCGWKGREHQGVGVHKDHALVLINPEKKSAKAILELADLIRRDVKSKFGVELEQEPRFLR